MKAFKVELYTKQKIEFVASTSLEIKEKLEKYIIVNEKSLNHIKVLVGELKSDIKYIKYYNFSAGNNSGNPVVYIKETTGDCNLVDSKLKLEEIKKYVTENYKELDLRPYYSIYDDGRVVVKLGLGWYFMQGQHHSYNEFRFCESFIDVDNVKKMIDKFIKTNK